MLNFLKLADLANFTMPWSFHKLNLAMDEVSSFLPAVRFDNETPIALEELEREYCRLLKHPYPIKEMVFARSWSFFRVRASLYIAPLRFPVTKTCFPASNHLTRHRCSVRATASQL